MSDHAIMYLSIHILTHARFLFHANDLPKNSLRPLVYIYAYYTTIYGRTAQDIDDQNMAADLYCDLQLTAQWGLGKLACHVR